MKAAEGILRLAQSKAKAKGIELDVGEFPSYRPETGDAADNEAPVRLVGHAVARLADRFAPLRKLSRHLEGTEAKAGLGSDIAAAAYEIYNRNSEQIDAAVMRAIKKAQEGSELRRTRAAAGGNGGRRFRGRSQSTPETPQEV